MLKLQCEETGSWLANGAPVNSYGRKAFRYVFIQTYTVHTSRICQPIRYVSPASHRIPEDMQNVVMSSIFSIIRHTGVRRLLTSVCPLNSVSQPTYVQAAVLRSRAIFPRLRLQIFFFCLRLQVKIFASGSTYKCSAPTGSGSNKQIFIQNI